MGNERLGGLPERVLVLQTAFIGDVMMTTPMIDSLRRGLPKASIDLLASPPASDLMADDPRVSKLIVYDKRNRVSGETSFLSLLCRIRRSGYDLLISPHRSARSRIISALSGIPLRIGFGRDFSLIYDRTVDPSLHEKTTEQYLSLLEPLGLELGEGIPSLPLSADEEQKGRALLEEEARGLSDPGIGLAPGSVWPTKRWPWESFAGLASRIIDERGGTVFLFGGKDDRAIGEKIADRLGRREMVNFIGRLPLRLSAALISRMAAMVTNDTGLLHIARARGVPTVSIFGPTTHRFFLYGDRDRPLTPDIDCHPCTDHGGQKCPLGHFRCMTEAMSVGRVFEALESILADPGAAG